MWQSNNVSHASGLQLRYKHGEVQCQVVSVLMVIKHVVSISAAPYLLNTRRRLLLCSFSKRYANPKRRLRSRNVKIQIIAQQSRTPHQLIFPYMVQAVQQNQLKTRGRQRAQCLRSGRRGGASNELTFGNWAKVNIIPQYVQFDKDVHLVCRECSSWL